MSATAFRLVRRAIDNPEHIEHVWLCDTVKAHCCVGVLVMEFQLRILLKNFHDQCMVVRVCILDVIHFVIILCVPEIFTSIPTHTGNPGEGEELCTNFIVIGVGYSTGWGVQWVWRSTGWGVQWVWQCNGNGVTHTNVVVAE